MKKLIQKLVNRVNLWTFGKVINPYSDESLSKQDCAESLSDLGLNFTAENCGIDLIESCRKTIRNDLGDIFDYPGIIADLKKNGLNKEDAKKTIQGLLDSFMYSCNLEVETQYNEKSDDIVGRLTAVDTKFATSEQDLAKAIYRVSNDIVQ